MLFWPYILIALLMGASIWAAPRAVRRAFRVPRHRERGTPADRDLSFETVEFLTERGKRLFGWFIPPRDGGPQPAMAVVHGWGGNAEFMLPLAPALHEAGWGLLLFDARCHGNSDDDDFASMPRFAEDLENAVEWLKTRPEVDSAGIGLLGHSVGAAASLLLASRRDDIAAVISVAAFADPAEVMRQMMAAKHIPYWPVGRWVLRYVEKAIGAGFAAIAPRNTITRVRCPVLLVHGDRDRTVPVGDVHELHARGGTHVQLLVVSGANHFSIDRMLAHRGVLVDFLRSTAPKGGSSG
ncbi:alpha/beta hydrolase [Thiohalomonas denitrificans]|uniref:alpha/beta hydrolase n=1 Tax=Thiohalomonas denitrificans TaxID=415747 RepID=UPI0026F1349F|nr:alpha/beta fold hydrolase [Thiohalomonas denitrificans]